MSKKLATCLSVLAICLTTSAFARDSQHISCAGYMNDMDHVDPDNYGLTLVYDEFRGPVIGEGEKAEQTRTEVLSIIFGGKLYQDTHREGDSTTPSTKIVDPSHQNRVFFAGTYEFGQESDDGQLTLKLKGKMNISPEESSSKAEQISTTLKCRNISN